MKRSANVWFPDYIDSQDLFAAKGLFADSNTVLSSLSIDLLP
jgi:hypothetical protein